MGRTGRRRFLLATAVLAASPILKAQTPARTVRIGILITGYEAASAPSWQAFRERLRELGYIEGRNLTIDTRYAKGVRKRLEALAEELIALRPDVIVAAATPATRAAMRATSTIPIVMSGNADPVGTGIISSLAHPGGNVTGQSMAITEIAAKWVEFLCELMPNAKDLGFLGQTSNTAILAVHRALQQAASTRGAHVRMFEAITPDEVDAAFEAMTREKYGGFMVAATSVLVPRMQQIVGRARETRLPAVYGREDYVVAGGLVSYITDRDRLFRHAADYVDRILRGAKPSGLPVEESSTFRLAINLKTAKAMGLVLPQSILIRADRVIK